MKTFSGPGLEDLFDVYMGLGHLVPADRLRQTNGDHTQQTGSAMLSVENVHIPFVKFKLLYLHQQNGIYLIGT